MIKFLAKRAQLILRYIRNELVDASSSWRPSKSNQYHGNKKRCLTIDRSRPLEIYLAKLEDLPFFLSFSPLPFFLPRPFAEKLRNVLKKLAARKIKDRSRGLPGKINLLLFKFHLDDETSSPSSSGGDDESIDKQR